VNPPRQSRSFSARAVRAVEDVGSVLGPGVVTGAADDDPSGIATYSQAGAQFGYGLLWTQLLSYPLMVAVQLVCAHIGRVTGSGLAEAMTRCFPKAAVTLLVAILLVANVINLGADLSAMGAAAALVVGGGRHLFVIAFALLTVGLLLFVSYSRYAQVLKWLTLSLFAYVGVVLLVRIDWNEALLGLVWPRDFGKDALLTIVALFGTTISPYLFFWQSSQEAEDLAVEHRRPLARSPRSAPLQYRRMRLDTLVGMGFSELIAMAIILTSAATLHVRGVTDIGSAEQAAEALRPIAGQFASALFALGIIGTGLLAVPVLAGSAAFAVSEARGWKSGLERKPKQARAFYAIIVAAVAIGVLFDWAGLNPIRALFWSAALNGICAAPIMVAMMIVAHRPSVMGRFTERWLLMTFGWAATAVMAIASVAMLVSFF
jgi:NRAMP (natural resistance-associated macrophage protein)-like metal ion transporter